MTRRPAIREAVGNIPLLHRVRNGSGARYEIKIDFTPDAISISGLNAKHQQTGAREYFDRSEEEQILNASNFCTELLMRGCREVPRR